MVGVGLVVVWIRDGMGMNREGFIRERVIEGRIEDGEGLFL